MGWITFCAYHGNLLITGFPSSIKNWKQKFVFVKCLEPFPFSTSWGYVTPMIANWEHLSVEEAHAKTLKAA